MTEYIGTSGNNSYTGTDNADVIVGNGGSDTLIGLAGWDIIFSGARNLAVTDPYDAPANAESLDKGSEADVLDGGDFDDMLFAGYNDSVDGGSQVGHGDVLYVSFQGASAGVNADFRQLDNGGTMTIGLGVYKNIENIGYLEGSNYADVLVLMDNQYMLGTHIYGAGGNDYILANYNSGFRGSSLYGGDGNDTIDARPAQYSPNIFGDAGNDTIYASGNIVQGGKGNDTIHGNGEFYGGDGRDHIFVEGGANVWGGTGDDDIHGSTYISSMFGEDGADTIIGGTGSESLYSASLTTDGSADDRGTDKDILAGGAGQDILSVGIGDDADGGADADSLFLSLAGSTVGVTLNTRFFKASQTFTMLGGTFQNLETFYRLNLTEFADRLTVAGLPNQLYVTTGAGNDVVTTTSSSANIAGGDGNDRLISGAGTDGFDGGDGIDTIDYSKYTTGVTVALSLVAGADGSGADGDVILNVENIVGSALADTLSGNDQVNSITGGAGNDRLTGGKGADTLSGGTGADRFVFAAVSDTGGLGNNGDLIKDFHHLEGDRIDLSALDAKVAIAGDQAFSFIGSAPFSHVAGQLRYGSNLTSTWVQGDTNGDGTTDFAIRMSGQHALVQGDFVL